MTDNRALALALSVFIAFFGIIFGSIAYGGYLESETARACIESGGEWKVDDETNQHECVRN